MALKHGTVPLFSARWVAGLAPVAEAGMAAAIQLFTPSATPIYDEALDQWIDVETIHYEGKARIQPLRTANEARNTGDSTTVQAVRVQIPISPVIDIRPNMQVRVTSAPLNPVLANYQYVVREVMDSSNPFERTFECTVNNETVVSN